MTPRAIGIDQGTTSTRALVLDEDGSLRLIKAGRHAQHYPHPNWVEHDPLELLANIRHCLNEAGAVPRIGLANQGESCLAWDARTGEPLSPVIVWQDGRTVDRIAELRADGAEAETLARAGLPLDPYFSASKLGWLLEHSQAVKAARRAGRLRLGTTDAFFLDRITGTFATDATTASRTSLMNLESGAWDPTLCELFGVPIETLPEIRETVGDFGAVGSAQICASIVDQQAGLFGHGCREPGDTKITFGTGAFVLTVTGDEIVRAPDRGMLPTVAWRHGGRATYAVDGGVYDAGSAIDWIRNLGLFAAFDELQTFDAAPAISRGVTFVPALSGLACPHWDRSAAATWIGMTAATTPRDLCQAVLEGIALRTAEVVEAIGSRVAIQDRISIDGGVAQSDYFAQFLADVLQRPVIRPAFHELTALGCAMLASGTDPEPVKAVGEHSRIFSPIDARGGEWRERFAGAVQRSRGWRA
ncbi:glycerol kinase [Bosea sp. OK403]|uniref:FGGY family carbohydrate kinase n=1 Tax=Bosea sp. OK403 TaxID=1855286 RepID=UPI0008F40DB6|nr:FGGY family carbohydrate kinase [Bosea sp. OK403]SFI48785.1 glycerol kinase [Bosea sp. OK403]